MSNDFAERRHFREFDPLSAHINSDWAWCGCQWCREYRLERFQRHTVDISDPAPKSVEDELSAFERGWSRVKCWAAFVLGMMFGACVGFWVLPGWVHHG